MDNQCTWQEIYSNTIIENDIIFRDDYLELTADMDTLLQTDITHKVYIYYINFSYN